MDIEKIKQKTLHKLLDQYEKSKTFTGNNQVNQSFSKRVGELFPKYVDDSEYDFFCDVNEALKALEMDEYVFLKMQRGSIVDKVILNQKKLSDCYHYLKRLPKKEENSSLEECLEAYAGLDILGRYVETQKQRIAKNHKVEYYDGDLKEFDDLLCLCRSILENEEEIYVRDFSVRLFRDSKRVEKLASKAQSLLFQYGGDAFAEKENVLEEFGIVNTPTYICMKGNARIYLRDQMVDLSKIQGDIALSTTSLKEVTMVEVCGSRVVTIENLTSFHDYSTAEGSDFVIYLGGFHNRTKRDFLRSLYRDNPKQKYLHFGDIDAGGFYIFEHLKKKTGIPFETIHMNVPTLKRYVSDCKKLTENDRRRIVRLLNLLETGQSQRTVGEDYSETLRYMLEHDCKLEQEALHQETFR
ncbi:MAG: hypothetical protein IKO03_09755 [Lachnospiraceae bacterium]|nr:hypothetical protein [Lachnospiraceae bacterium]MBR6151112.1 hypothetical protein [Lachnospiraceae bacterium]